MNHMRLHSLIRAINHGNAIVSTYGTNFEYTFESQLIEPGGAVSAASQSVTYDDGCLCQMTSNCTTQAMFIERNASIPVPGMKVGCLPSESFRLSTLQCFYEQSCLDLIRNYTNSTQRLEPLSSANSRFSMNATFDALMENLFVEQWNTTMNYSSYFSQCSPLLCSYTYEERFNVLSTAIFILGLKGGLVIVLKWICPKVIRVAAHLYRLRRKRISPIPSVRCDGPAEQSIPTVSSPRQVSRRTFLFGILLAVVVLGLAIFSVRVARQEKYQAAIISVSSSSMETTTTAFLKTTPTANTTASTTTEMRKRMAQKKVFSPLIVRNEIMCENR